MTVEEADVRALSPGAIEAFLRSEGWQLLRSPFPRATVWANKERTDRLVVIPTTRSVDDYTDQIGEVLRTVAVAYGDSEEALLSRLSAGPGDVLTFQESSPERTPGTIGVREGVALFEGIRDTLSAGLKSSLGRAPYYGQRFWPEAKEFLNRAQFGQTRSGSYIVTVLPGTRVTSEVLDLLGTPADRAAVESQRAITTHLMRALAAAKSVLSLDQEPEPDEGVQQLVDSGVSADLLSAIRRMTPWHEGGQITVTAQWSPLVPVDVDVPDEVSFTYEERPYLEAADTRLKESEVTPGTELLGHIEMLRRDVAEEQPAQVTLVAERGPIRRGAKVRIAFDEADYQVAIEAHQARAWVRVVGDLTKSRTRFWMRNLESFDIIPENQLFRE